MNRLRHGLSSSDRDFQARFEACAIAAGDFDHRAHVRLAYAYLSEGDTAEAIDRMKKVLLNYLQFLGIGSAKYHETMTVAWIHAVAHFMHKSDSCSDFGEFIERNSKLLDPDIMFTHYSSALLFSESARRDWAPPDLQSIPEH